MSVTMAGDPNGAPPSRPQRLTRRMRVRKRSEFLKIQAAPRKFSGRHYTVLAQESERQEGAMWRLGITVSRKVGNAVTRNRVKRWVRESFRRHAASLRGDTNIVVMLARPPQHRAIARHLRNWLSCFASWSRVRERPPASPGAVRRRASVPSLSFQQRCCLAYCGLTSCFFALARARLPLRTQLLALRAAEHSNAWSRPRYVVCRGVA
jgi:ribonuclease P protein component